MKKLSILAITLIIFSSLQSFWDRMNQWNVILGETSIENILPLEDGTSCRTALLFFIIRTSDLMKARQSQDNDKIKDLTEELRKLEEIIKRNPCVLPDGRQILDEIKKFSSHSEESSTINTPPTVIIPNVDISITSPKRVSVSVTYNN